MAWTVRVPARVEKELDHLSVDVREQVREVLTGLETQPRPHRSKKLKGSLSCWRIRVGRYRILYDIDDKLKMVDLVKVGLRKDVYR